jgi:O-antigen/teichoic acid export membrane protein
VSAVGNPQDPDRPGNGSTPPALDSAQLQAEQQRLQADAVGGSLWTSLQAVLSLPLSVAANVVVAQSLGAAAYGTLAVYLAVYGIAAAVLNAGISDASVQWIATHNARMESLHVERAIRRCAGYHVYVEAPLLALLVVAMLRNAGTTAMVVGGTAAFFTMVIGTSTVVLSGLGLNALAARLSIVLTLAAQSTLVATALTSGEAGSVFVGRLAATFLGPLIVYFFVPRQHRRALLRPIPPFHWPTGFLSFALKTCVFGIVTSLVFSRSELFVFQAYGLYEAAGVFALAAGVGGLITAPIDALLGPLLPATAGLLATTPARAGGALLRGLRTSGVLAGLVAALGIPLLAPLLPLIYGQSFAAATGAFIVLALVSCFQSVSNPILAFLLAARSAGTLVKVSLAFVVVDLGLAALTIPHIGIAGAVIGSTIAQVGVLAVTSRRVGQILSISVREQWRAIRYFTEAASLSGIVVLTQLAVNAPAGLEAVASLVCSVLALAVIGRLRPGSGLAGSDVHVIATALPRLFARPFMFLVRFLALTAAQPVPQVAPR